MLKVGDKLLCKKNFLDVFKNNYYIISSISITIVSFKFYSQEGKLMYSRGFSIKKSIHQTYLWDCFYKPNELRKLKLKQIQNVESR